jgi:predicted transposase YdaD
MGYWLDVMYSKNNKILYKEAKMTGRQMLFRDLVADGFFVDELRESREIGVQEGWQKGRQEGRQEGWQKGRQEGRLERQQEIFALLRKGYAVDEVEEMLCAKP